jgi:hypothetical protein
MTTAMILLLLIAAIALLVRWTRHDDLATHGRVAWFD